MWLTLLPQIFEIVIFPLLAVLTGFAIKWINAKANELSQKREDEIEKKYIDMLNETITDCVLATTQTYVATLKQQGKFDEEAQKKAFCKSYNAVMSILSTDAVEYLTEIVGDLDTYLTQKIEAEVLVQK